MSAAAINKIFADSSEEEYRSMIMEAGRDLRTWVRGTFSLSDEQQQALDELKPAHVKKVRTIMKRSLSRNQRTKIVINYLSPSNTQESQGTSVKTATVRYVRDGEEQAKHLREKIKEKQQEIKTLQDELGQVLDDGPQGRSTIFFGKW